MINLIYYQPPEDLNQIFIEDERLFQMPLSFLPSFKINKP